MDLTDKIHQRVRRLPVTSQAEALDFVVFLPTKAERESIRQEETDWSSLSLTLAMRGMEDDDGPVYTEDDLNVTFS